VNIAGTLQYATELLQGAGLTAGPDTDKLNPPCAWIAPDAMRTARLDGSGELDVSIYLIAQDLGYAVALEQLQGMLDQALTVIAPDGEVDLAAGVQTSAGVLPAFKIPLTLEVEA
jgi:hypothetical protein